jgi:hypothetical protein
MAMLESCDTMLHNYVARNELLRCLLDIN